MILDRIVEKKRIQLEKEMQLITLEAWKPILKRPGLHAAIDFYGALKKNRDMAIIAEVKKASPSKGVIKEDFNPVSIAGEYCKAGVEAISVLTEERFFLGSAENLAKIRQSSAIPLLRKDFIIDVWQIYQSRYLGADAILLIAAILNDEELKKFQIIAGILGLQCLVEVHDRIELERVLESGAKIIGINNRDLKTFDVDLSTTEKLMNYIPSDRVVVSESGISNHADIKRLREIGVDAVLVGESLMRASSIGDKINELRVG